ncbi:MAG: hypothetical protein ABI224_00240 [Acetobacteraceae bacterium]
MERRAFLAGTAATLAAPLAAPLGARAQDTKVLKVVPSADLA